MESLEAQHKELLQAQLASLRREILSGTEHMPINGHKGALELSADVQDQQAKATSGSETGLEDLQLQTEHHEELKSSEPELVPADTMPCLESPSLDIDLPNTGLTTRVLEDKQEVSLSPMSSKKRSSADDTEGIVEAKVQRVC